MLAATVIRKVKRGSTTQTVVLGPSDRYAPWVHTSQCTACGWNARLLGRKWIAGYKANEEANRQLGLNRWVRALCYKRSLVTNPYEVATKP